MYPAVLTTWEPEVTLKMNTAWGDNQLDGLLKGRTDRDGSLRRCDQKFPSPTVYHPNTLQSVFRHICFPSILTTTLADK